MFGNSASNFVKTGQEVDIFQELTAKIPRTFATMIRNSFQL